MVYMDGRCVIVTELAILRAREMGCDAVLEG
jgi:hypothetical protein